MRITRSFRLREDVIKKIYELAKKYRKARSEILEDAVEYLFDRGIKEIEELRKRVKELEETIEIMKNEREAINTVKELYQNEIERLQNEIERLQNKIEKLQNEIAELQNEPNKKKKWRFF